MGDLIPFYLAARQAKQADIEAAAGDAALAQYGSAPVKVQTDVTKINPTQPGGAQTRPSAEPQPEEPSNTVKIGEQIPAARDLPKTTKEVTGGPPAAEPPKLLSELLAASGAPSEHVATAQAAEKLGEYIANTNSIAELQQKLMKPEGLDLISSAGLSMPVVNAVMHLTRQAMEAGGVPEPYASIGEYASALLVPSRTFLAAGKATGALAAAAGTVGKAAAGEVGAVRGQGLTPKTIKFGRSQEAEGFRGWILQDGQIVEASPEGHRFGLAEGQPEANIDPKTAIRFRAMSSKPVPGLMPGIDRGFYDIKGPVSEAQAREIMAMAQEFPESVIDHPLTYSAANTPSELRALLQSFLKGGALAAPQEPAAAAAPELSPTFLERIAKVHAETGGSTTSLSTGTNLAGTRGYAVSTFKNLEQVLDHPPTSQDLQAYIQGLPAEVRSNPALSLGTWESAGKHYLDVSQVEPSLTRALQLGQENKQQAVFNLRTMQEVPVPQAGGPQSTVEAAGMKWLGVTQDFDNQPLAWFNDPVTGSTLAMPAEGLTAESIAAHVAENRKAWGLGAAAVAAATQDENDPYAGTAIAATVGIGTGNLKLLRSPTLSADIASMAKNSRLAHALAADGAAVLLRRGVTAWTEKMQAYGVPAEQLDTILARSKEIASNGISRLRNELIPLEGAFPYWREASGRPDWYASPAILKETFGPDTNLMAGLLAATSPQQNAAKANIDAALEVYRILKTTPESEWKSVISKDNYDLTKFFGIAGENAVPNVWRAIRGEPLSGNKVNDFFHALIGDESVFTVDRHMGRLIAPEYVPAKAQTLNDAEYATLADWGKEFASRIGETPRYTQQRLWVGYRLSDFFGEGGAIMGQGNEPFFENLAQRAKDQGILDLVPKAPFLDEAGRTRAATAWVLGRAAAGALAGSYIGDTPEDRFRNALIGAGVVGVAPGTISKMTRWLTEHAPSVRNAVRKPLNQYPPEVGQELDRLFTGYDAELAQARRGVRPHSLAWQEADQMIRDGRMSLDEVRAAFPGMTLNDAEAGAFIKTVATYGEQVQTYAAGLQDAVRAGKPLSLDQIDGLLTRLYTLREFLPKQAGVLAETGRTLSFMNEPTSGINQYLSQWHDLFTDPAKDLSPEKLIDAVAGFKLAGQHAALARLQQEPGWAQMAIEGLYGALLGNPVTLAVNTVSNMIAQAYAPVERAGAAAFGNVTHWTEPFALVYGYGKAVPKAFEYAWHTFQTGERQIAGLSKVESPRGPVSGATSQWLEQTLLGKIAETAVPMTLAGGMYAAGVDPAVALTTGIAAHPRFWPLGPRIMSATDELFKVMLYEGENWAQAVRRGAPIRDEALRSQKILEMVSNPNSRIQAESERFANEFTFNSPPGPILQGVINGLSDPNLPGAYKVLFKSVVPFTNVPNNLFKFVGRRTPGLQFLHAGFLSDLSTPGPKQDAARAQLALGAAWLAAVGTWAAEGGVTGSGPADPNLMREWLADGNQEYSVTFGNKTFSLNRMDPWGQMTSIIADWTAVSAHMDDATNDQIAAALLMYVSKDIMSKSYFEGGAAFLDAITNKDPNKAYRWLYQYTATPIPSVVKQQRNIQDPYLREVRDLVDSAMNRFPDTSVNLAPRKNVFADPIINHEPIGYGIDLVNPFMLRTKKNDPASKAVLENRISVAMPPWSIYGNPNKSWTLDPQRESVGIPLTHGLYDELVNNIGKPLKKAWLEYVNSPDYQKDNLGPDSQNALVFKRLYQAYHRAGVAELIDRHPELLKSLEDVLAHRAAAISQPQPPRPPAAGIPILDRLQGVGAPGATQ